MLRPQLAILFLVLLLLPASAGAGDPPYDKPFGSPEKPALLKETPRERDDRPMDVLHYDLELRIDPEPAAGEPVLEGRVELELTPTAPLGEILLDLTTVLTVDRVELDGVPVAFLHADEQITLALPDTLRPGDGATVAVEYHGTPVRSGLMGFTVRDFPDPLDPAVLLDEPVVATLSEPDQARSWWPCHDTPYDAATFTLSVRGPADFVLASAGDLVEDVDLGGGLRRQTWDMPTPVPAYLVSIAYARYVRWEETMTVHRWPTGEEVEMPLVYYAPEPYRAACEHSWSTTAAMIETFERLYGPYPFPDLKYGMALFVFGGAMEHPTMSSMGRTTVNTATDEFTGGPRAEWIVAHELAHQWFGDCVRVERWGEIWLNEGFARYSEALWMEERYGHEHLKRWMEDLRQDSFAGTLVDPTQLFGRTSYDKGAWTLHMLGQVLGREGLLTAMREYVTDPALRFQPVSSADFQAHCEAVYGESLDWFFVPWLTREGRPQLTVHWRPVQDGVELTVEQPADRAYRLPLPVRLQLQNGELRDRVLWVEGASTVQTLDAGGEPSPVAWVLVDADRDWLLDTTISSSSVRAGLLEPFPNPFNPSLTVRFVLAKRDDARIDIYDVRGRRVRALYDQRGVEGFVRMDWDGTDDGGARLASGVYYIHLRTASGAQETQKATLIR